MNEACLGDPGHLLGDTVNSAGGQCHQAAGGRREERSGDQVRAMGLCDSAVVDMGHLIFVKTQEIQCTASLRLPGRCAVQKGDAP